MAAAVDWDELIASEPFFHVKKESCKDEHSFCSLVEHRKLDQSQNISLGNCMEKLFHNVIAKNTAWKNINGGTKKGEHQKDHIWLNESTREIIYAEQKNNVNLDTEKLKATEKKVAEVAAKYPDYTIHARILAARYLSTDEPLAAPMKKKYKNIPIVGVNDYVALFGMEPLFADYTAYKAIIRKVVDTKFGPVSS